MAYPYGRPGTGDFVNMNRGVPHSQSTGNLYAPNGGYPPHRVVPERSQTIGNPSQPGHPSEFAHRQAQPPPIQQTFLSYEQTRYYHSSFTYDSGIEECPSKLDQPLLRSPLYSTEPIIVPIPHLIDCIFDVLPSNHMDYESVEVLPPKAVEELGKVRVDPEFLRTDKRGYAVAEMLQTEQNFCRNLGILDTYIRKKLLESGVVDEPDVHIIFTGFDELYTFHRYFLDSLESLLNPQDWDPNTTQIGKLFADNTDRLVAVYGKFIDASHLTERTIKKYEKREAYNQFMEEASRSPETGKRQLKDFLILPVQQSSRYALHLNAIVKQTPSDHPDLEDLKAAAQKMSELGATVNVKKQRAQEQALIFDISMDTKDTPPLFINAKRRVVYTADATDVNLRKKVRVYICSDSLLIATYVSREKRGGLAGLLGSSASTIETTHPFIFLRWIDFKDVTTTEELRKDTLAITCYYEREGTSFTVPVPQFDDGTNNKFKVVLKFEHDYDPEKTLKDFNVTLQSEQKRSKSARAT
ncbi:rho guanine nucleotide exchange factor [Polychytrium aggregatum]|uniref:rho guanine nucleotide exchange factor n=1 Tax=Polychytrium aggregatum TaxID=110093 RepID=UPI0022FF2002|nr:rho guanine nucleotide exchange factor [Polychytrium aggregatum]KAI9190805.1 Dbl homology domain-containing protein [Polychytrium aggregatum]